MPAPSRFRVLSVRYVEGAVGRPRFGIIPPMNRLFRSLALALLAPGAARACAVCLGGAASTQRDAVNAGLLSMLGVMGVVLGVAGFFVARMIILSRGAGEGGQP